MTAAWGHGAISVDAPEKGWRCPECGKRARRDTGRALYADGSVRCSDCAGRAS